MDELDNLLELADHTINAIDGHGGRLWTGHLASGGADDCFTFWSLHLERPYNLTNEQD